MKLYRWIVAAGLVLQSFMVSARNEEYWTYSYDNVDVTAANAIDARTMVRNIHRLDQAARQLLGSSQEEKPRTHVYAVPRATFQRLSGLKDSSAMFSIVDGENIALVDSQQADSTYWDTYFGYSGSILMSDGVLRYPDWFRTGFADSMAATVVKGNQVTLGGTNEAYAYWLQIGPLIPIRAFLNMHPNDPQLKSGSVGSVYRAQCWFLTHLILFENRYHSEFAQYFRLIDRGQTPDDAFAASFKVDYQVLDKMLRDELRDRRINTYVGRMPEDAADTGQAHQITVAAANADFGVVAARLRHPDEGRKFAEASLAAEPENETGLQALALSQLGLNQYADALKTSDRFANDVSLSASGHAVRASLRTALAAAIRQKLATLDADPKELLRLAAEDYQKAIALDPDSLSDWAQFAHFLARNPDSKVMETFFPQVVHTYYQHTGSAILARAIEDMCAATGDFTNALKFAAAWRENAISPQDRDNAAAEMSHVKAMLEQRNAASAP